MRILLLMILMIPPPTLHSYISKARGREENTESTGLAEFFQEPKLGTSWYNPSGPEPTFDMAQANGTVYTSQLGADVFMSCKVTALEKDLVSWLRRRDLFPVLLTVGFLTHSQDSRFSVDFAPPNDYRLKVSNVGWNDAGLYLCQLAVHPPALIWTRLEIDPPVVHLLDVDGAPVWELHYDVGTTLEMMCRIKRPPLQGPYTVEWEAQSDQGQVRVLHRDVERGGVRVDTGMEIKSGFLFSRISLASAKVSDAGNYTCRLGGVPQPVLQSYPHLEDTIVVHVLQGEITKAIHGKATRLKILQIPTILTSLLPIFWTTMLPRSI